MSRWLAGLRVAFRSIVRRRHVEDELNEEIQFHLDRQIDEELNTGLAPEEARDAALRAMGAIEKSKEECRDLRSANVVSDFIGDLRYAGRSLRRSPGFAVLAIVIMGLGIGANTAAFSVVNAVLLRPLPYPGADRIMAISTTASGQGNTSLNPLVTLANFQDWRDQSTSFEAMATYRAGEAPVTPGDTAEYGQHANVDGQFFRVLSVEPILGRTFSPEETAIGSNQPAALISYTFWQNRFGGDPKILQRTIRLGNAPRPIVGVLPPGFHFPGRTDVWSNQPVRANASRTNHSFLAVGRLKPGVSLEQANAEFKTVAAALEQQYPESNKGRGVAAMPLRDSLVGNVRLTLYLLWGVVGVVLLIACANTATLLLGKATTRTREVAVRAALGASRRRIIRQLIAESLLLGLVAGGVGMLLAYWGARALVALTPFDVVRTAGADIDGGVLALTLIVSITTSLAFGIVPALHASKVDLTEAVKLGGRSVMGGGMLRTRGMLVVSEIALAVVLVTGAGLLIKSLVALHNADLGFQPQNVLVMKATGVRSLPENNAYFREVRSRIAALAGVVAVGATSVPPGDLSNLGDGSYFIDQRPAERDGARETTAHFTVIAPGTFAALGIPLKSGRDFTESDTADTPMVAIVNEALVRKSFGDQNPIGRTIFCSFDSPAAMTIVGVVGDSRQRNPGIAPVPDCIMPYGQHSYNNRTLYVVTRTAGDPTALAGTLRRLAADVSPEVPVSFTTMDALVSKGVEDPSFRALLFSVFAALAVCLAMAGVYGAMAYSAQQRSKEIGLRMALGASRASVLRLILKQGLVLAGIGLALGLGGAVAATRLLATVLFQVKPVDIQVYVAVAILLGFVTLVAGYLPARRAAGADPVEVLKTD
jgi:predicted permease